MTSTRDDPALIVAGDRTVPVTVQARVAAPPDLAFRVIAPIDLSLVFAGRGPLPGVRGVADQTGPWDAPGRTRRPLLTDGSTALERLTEHTAPHSFAYELTAFTNVLGRMAEGVRGEWTFTPDRGGTLIRWTYEFKPLPGRRWLLRAVVAPLWRRSQRQAMGAAIGAVEDATRPRASSVSRIPSADTPTP